MARVSLRDGRRGIRGRVRALPFRPVPFREVRPRGPHLRRRPAGAGRVGRPPERRHDRDAADAHDRAQPPGRVGGDGHRHRGEDGDRPRPRGRHRDRSPQPLDRRAGRRDRQGQALRGRDDRRAADAAADGEGRRRAGADGALPRLGRADHRRGRPACRDPHEPRPPLREGRHAGGVGGDDERDPRDRVRRDDARGGRAAPPPPPDREAAGRGLLRRAQGPDHGEGHPEADRVPVRDQGSAGPTARGRGSRRRPGRRRARRGADRRRRRRAGRRHRPRSLERRGRDGDAHQAVSPASSRWWPATSQPRRRPRR